MHDRLAMTCRLLLVSAVIVVAGVAIAGAQDGGSLNLALFDHLNPVRTDSIGPSSALWGYLAPDGREYALVGTQDGTHIIDITEKPIHEVAYIRGPKSIWREMKIYKKYAYIVTESAEAGKGLQIVDLSGLPGSAELVRTDSVIISRAHTIYINTHYLYLMGTQADAGANGGAIIFDLDPDPLHPRRVGMVNPYYYHDAWERNDTLVGAAINGQGADIYDVRDKTNPKHLATITYPFSGTHNAEITSDGGYVITSDEVGSTPKTMKVWDIHDLENIHRAAEFTPNMTDIVHNVHVRGRYVIAAWYTAGVRIIDMIDPTHPREVAYYDTYPGNSGDYNGAWEAYGFFPSGKVIVGDRQTGLYVLTFNYATAGSVYGVVRNRTTGEPMPGVTLAIGETGANVTTDAAGGYYVGGPNGATRTLTTAPFGFGGRSEQFTLNGDTQHDILLDPLQFYYATVKAVDGSGDSVSDFSFAVEPYLHSAYAAGGSATLLLPRDSSYTLTVGKWGYRPTQITVQLTGNAQTVMVELVKGYRDDATLDLGWSFETIGDNATSGRWTRVVPSLTFAGSDWIFPAVEPSGNRNGMIFQTGAPQRDVPAQYGDVNGGHTTLTSPLMDLREFQHPQLEFDLWFVHYKRDTVRDSLRVEITNDDGASWRTIDLETEGRGGWKARALPLPADLPLTASMRMRISASDTLGNAYFFAGMDNFAVAETPPSAVPFERMDTKSALSLSVVPNPMRGSGTVSVSAAHALGFVRLELYTADGRRTAVLFEGAMGPGEHDLKIGALPAGSYLLRATTGSGESVSRKLVVHR